MTGPRVIVETRGGFREMRRLIRDQMTWRYALGPAFEPVDLVSVNNRQDEAYGYTPAGELVRVIAR